MKILLVKLSLISIFISNSIFSQGLYSIHSPDGINIFAVGKNGTIMHSRDSGNGYDIFHDGNSDFHSVFSIPYSGYIFTFIAGENGRIEKCTDNGVSWDVQFIGNGASLNSIYFTDHNTGWIAGDNGSIYKTTNSGQNWNSQISNTTFDLNCIKFINASTGLACGDNGIVLKSTNGGNNWTIINTNITGKLESIDFVSNTIIAVGLNSTVIKSTDMGGTWNVINYNILTKSDVNSVHMFDESKQITCGGGGFIRITTDGGSTFTLPSNPMFGDLYSIFFSDNLNGWAAGRQTNAIIKTTDGGITWSFPNGTGITYNWVRVLSTSSNQFINGQIMSFNNNNHTLYAGIGNKLFRSFDLGSNWIPFSTLPEGNLSQGVLVSPKDSNKILYLVHGSTDSFKLFSTTNYGTNWNTVFSDELPTVGAPLEFDYSHPDTIYLGVRNVLWRSLNFGTSWSQVYTFSTSVHRHCHISVNPFNSNHILVNSPSPGRTFKSTDWGNSFSISDIDTTSLSEAPGLVTSNLIPNSLYHTFFNSNYLGGIRKSTNNGTSWFQSLQNSSLWGLDIAKDDPNVIIAGNYSHPSVDVFISSDGGNNYVESSQLGNNSTVNTSIFSYDKGNIFVEQLDGIYKLNITYSVPIGIHTISTEIPRSFSLSQNYPNPFNPSTKIKFEIAKASDVKLEIYDVNGKVVSIIVNEHLNPGVYESGFDGSKAASGIYFYKILTKDFTETKKMILLK